MAGARFMRIFMRDPVHTRFLWLSGKERGGRRWYQPFSLASLAKVFSMGFVPKVAGPRIEL